MSGKTDLNELLKTIQPLLNEGEYVFCTVPPDTEVDKSKIIGLFREKEGLTIILEKQLADSLGLQYSYIAAWITLTIHSSLEGVGFTAAFSKALAAAGIGCNVIAAYYHDHIFVAQKDAEKALAVLQQLACG